MSEKKIRAVTNVGRDDIQGRVYPPDKFMGYFRKEDVDLVHPYMWPIGLMGIFCWNTMVLKQKVDILVDERPQEPHNLPVVIEVVPTKRALTSV